MLTSDEISILVSLSGAKPWVNTMWSTSTSSRAPTKIRRTGSGISWRGEGRGGEGSGGEGRGGEGRGGEGRGNERSKE